MARLRFFLILLLVACGPTERKLEKYEDMRDQGIVLTADRHPHGWGRSGCLLCHNVEYNVHRNPGSPADADAIARNARSRGGATTCLACHGNNGTR